MKLTITDERMTRCRGLRRKTPTDSRLNQRSLYMAFRQPAAVSSNFGAAKFARTPEALGNCPLRFRKSEAFTLIELLAVIAIAALIAALIVTAGGAMVRKSNLQRAMSERDQLETAIEAYHAKYGFYPPSGTNALINPLYYELLGTTASSTGTGTNYTTLDGGSQIAASVLPATFGVSSFMNCTRGSGDDAIPAQTFLSGLKSGEIASNGSWNIIVTAANSDAGYKPLPGVFSLAGRPANPWRYIYPGTNNPTSYDLWVQVLVGNKTNLICNWAKNPELNVPLE